MATLGSKNILFRYLDPLGFQVRGSFASSEDPDVEGLSGVEFMKV